MYKKYNYIPSQKYNTLINPYRQQGLDLFNSYKNDVELSLDKYIADDNVIDGTALQSNWFKQYDMSIFISHSHNDRNKALSLAGWIYENFGINSFIDSCIWGYGNDLLKKIDNKYCRNNDGKTYSYERRNFSTSHVHAMLSMALMQMINQTETIIFVNTPNSISLKADFNSLNKDNSETKSPWIYEELSIMNYIKLTIPERLNTIKHQFRKSSDDAFDVEYNVDEYLRQMILLSDDDLDKWKRNHDSSANALNELYILKK